MLTENNPLPASPDGTGAGTAPDPGPGGLGIAPGHDGPARDLASLLPESVRAGSSRRRQRRRRVVIAAVGVAVLVGAGFVVARSSDASEVHYRTATVATHAVAAELHGVATIEPVKQATVAFPVAGTVAGVDVTPGTAVAAGQRLAQLDTADLVATLHQKEAALAEAQLALSKALDGQASALPSSSATRQALVEPEASSSSSSSSSSSDSSATSGPADAVLLAAVSPAPDPKLAAAQQAVLKAQQTVDAAMTDAATAVTAAQSVCAAAGISGGSGGSGGSPTPGEISACQTALAAVQTAQATVSQAQSTLAEASKALDDLLQQQASTPPTTTVPPTTGPPTSTPPTSGPPTTGSGGAGHGGRPGSGSTPPTSSGPTSSTPTSTPTTGRASGRGSARQGSAGFGGGGNGGTGNGGSGGGSGSSGSAATARTPTAADLAAYQSAVDVAALNVTVAQQAIAQATIVSPIKGTVIAVNLTKGETVTAASTTADVVVKGEGGYDASTTVSLNDISSVKVGQAASVLPDGSDKPVTGKVVSIAAVPETGTTTTTSFAVVIGLTGDTAALGNGAIGSATIVTGSTASGLTVPTSAVTTTGAIHTVTVLVGGTTQQVPVQVGVMGAAWTEITRGLSAGEQVVLADLDQPLPSSATASSTSGANARTQLGRLAGLGGGLGGAGFGGFGANRGAGTNRTGGNG